MPFSPFNAFNIFLDLFFKLNSKMEHWNAEMAGMFPFGV